MASDKLIVASGVNCFVQGTVDRAKPASLDLQALLYPCLRVELVQPIHHARGHIGDYVSRLSSCAPAWSIRRRLNK